MASNKLKYSLGIAAVFALALAGYSFSVSSPYTSQAPTSDVQLQSQNNNSATLEIYPGDGSVRTLDIHPDGKTSLFDLMKTAFEQENIAFDHKNYSTMGELVTQIGLKKNGEENKYWQFWVNDEYAKVGVSAYIVEAGDKIKWKFTNDSEQK